MTPAPGAQSGTRSRRNIKAAASTNVAVAAILGLLTVQLAPFTTPSVLIALIVSGVLLVAYRRQAIEAARRYQLWLLLPIMAVISCVWSTAPPISLRYGVQLLWTIYIGLFVTRIVPARRFVSLMLWSNLVFALLSLASNIKGGSASGPVLIGLTGSKDAMTLVGVWIVFAATAMVSDGRYRRIERIVAALALPVGLYIVLITASATSLVLVVLFPVLYFPLRILAAMPFSARAAAALSAAICLVPLAAAADDISAALDHFRTDVLHKDATLTGRTVLWDKADAFIARRPLLGRGYDAIWLDGSPDNIGLLRWAKVSDGRGFSFHDTVRQFGVDLGYVGEALVILSFFGAFAIALGFFLYAPSADSAFYLANLIFLLLRLRTENSLIPFNVNTMIVYAVFAYAVSSRGARDRAVAKPRPAHRFRTFRAAGPRSPTLALHADG